MEFTCAFHDELGILEVIAEGKAMVDDYERIVVAILEHPNFRKGLPTLHDQRNVTLSHRSNDDIRMIAHIGRKYFKAFGMAKWAVVMPTDVQYGMTRMWQMFVDEYLKAVPMIFRDRDEAIAWLMES